MLFFKKRINKADLVQHKNIRVGGFDFVIRKINPLSDFPSNNIPQIFTSFISRRKAEPTSSLTMPQILKSIEDMKLIIQVGLVKPKLVTDNKEDGITIDDLFRDTDIVTKLYFEILTHSLNKYRGLSGVFFSAKIRHMLYTEWRKHMGKLQQKLFTQMEDVQ